MIPNSLTPVLAHITHQGSLGESHWYEVVYYNSEIEEWESYGESKTFLDGERVGGWQYADSIEMIEA